MKRQSVKSFKTVSVCALCVCGVLVVSILTELAQSEPVLTVAPYGTNQFRLTITNANPAATYEIYRVPVLNDPNYPWTLCATGAVGQSNWTVDMGWDSMGFFRASEGSDWDGDGIPNWMDANPSDPNVGTLSITIDSPINGTVLQ